MEKTKEQYVEDLITTYEKVLHGDVNDDVILEQSIQCAIETIKELIDVMSNMTEVSYIKWVFFVDALEILEKKLTNL